MAIFRKIHVQFWSDVFIQSLTPEQKFFFLYLLTNERTKQCGIYEITSRQISYDTGYNVETINKLIEFFENAGKLLFSRETNEIAIKNWDKYNSSRSPDVQNLVNKEVKSVKNKKLIEWVQSGNTVLPLSEKSLREEPEPEKNQNKNQNQKKATVSVFFPKEDFNLDLSEMNIGKAIEYLSFTKNVKATKEMVLAIWGAFKAKNFTGEKSYKSENDIVRHFFETLKFEKIDGTKAHRGNSPDGSKSGTSVDRIKTAKEW